MELVLVHKSNTAMHAILGVIMIEKNLKNSNKKFSCQEKFDAPWPQTLLYFTLNDFLLNSLSKNEKKLDPKLGYITHS